MRIKLYPFCKGTFQGSSIDGQIYHLEPWDVAQNCPRVSSHWNIYHCLTIISYTVSKILNIREGYSHPKIPNFDRCPKDGIGWPVSPLQLLHHSNWTQLNAKYNIQIHQWHIGVIGFTNVQLCSVMYYLPMHQTMSEVLCLISSQ